MNRRLFFAVLFALFLTARNFAAENLALVAPSGEVVFYTPCAREYLEADSDTVSVQKLATGKDESQGIPTTFRWEGSFSNVQQWELTWGTRTVTLPPDCREFSVKNLLRGTRYEGSVTAVLSDGTRRVAKTTFTTSHIGPRVILVDGLHNVRDLGGYSTSLGKTVRQGLLFRGSEMNGKHGIQIAAAGRKTMVEELGIRTDLDFRSPKEALEITESPLGKGVKLVFIPIGGYMAAFSSPKYAEIFALLAEEKNYPIYFHCWGGADRTGTVAFLVNALLGVSEENLIRDYEFTSFSVFGIRSRIHPSFPFPEFYETLRRYQGTTLAEKTENYLLSIGVTAEQIRRIRKIMLE